MGVHIYTIQIKQVQNPWLFYILSPNKNNIHETLSLHCCCSDLTFCSFSWRKTKPGLCISLQVSSQAIPLLANSTSNTRNWQNKIFLLSAHSHSTLRLFTYHEWWFLFYVYLMQEFIEAHPVFAAKARMEKWKLKKNYTHRHTHTRDKQKEMNFGVPTCPMNFTWCNFDGKCIRVVHPADKIFAGLWYNGRKALWWNIQITEERQNFLMCKYGYLPEKSENKLLTKCY